MVITMYSRLVAFDVVTIFKIFVDKLRNTTTVPLFKNKSGKITVCYSEEHSVYYSSSVTV